MRHIIYLPGLDGTFTDPSLASFARRYMHALDLGHPDARYRFTMQMNTTTLSNGQQVESAHIFAIRDHKEIETHRIYTFNYKQRLVNAIVDRNLATRAAMLVFALFVKVPRILHVLFLPRKRSTMLRGARFQIGYVAVALGSMGLLGILLLGSLLTAIGDFLLVENHSPIASLIRTVWNYTDQILLGLPRALHGYAEYGVAFSAALYLLSPKLQPTITSLANDFLCLIYYFEHGTKRLDMIGGVGHLVEHVSEEADQDSKIDVYAYSFGSLLALDALYPRSGIVARRMVERVDRLVTIGCPFDFVNTYWPSYFRNRSESQVKLSYWLNVYSSIDVLGSNFRHDALPERGTIHVSTGSALPHNLLYDQENADSIGLIQYATMVGMTSHASAYWDSDPASSSCLDGVLAIMESRPNE